MLAFQHIIAQMRIDRCRDIAPSRLDLRHDAQDRRQIVAFGKALAAHQAFALENLIGHQETVRGQKIDLGMVRPAREQALQDTRGRALADSDAARHADDIGHFRIVDMKEVMGGAEQFLGRRDIEIEKARQGKIDRHDLVEIDAVVQAAQFVEIALVQGERRIGAQFRPFLAREAAEGRDLLGKLFHDQTVLRPAFSARPLVPTRLANSLMTSESGVPETSRSTMR